MDVDLTSLAGPSLWSSGNITLHAQGCTFALMAHYFISVLYFYQVVQNKTKKRKTQWILLSHTGYTEQWRNLIRLLCKAYC